MAPYEQLRLSDYADPETLKKLAKAKRWREDYAQTVALCAARTRQTAASASQSWRFILGRRCFVGNIKSEDSESLADLAGRVKIPLLIAQRKDQSEVSKDTAHALYDGLANAENRSLDIGFFELETDKELLNAIKSWLDRHLPVAPKEDLAPVTQK